MSNPARRLKSPAKAAGYADVSTRTIYRWIAEGRLRAYRTGPKLIKVDLADIDALIRPVPAANHRAG
jgi:excisionase family DNA binding protein